MEDLAGKLNDILNSPQGMQQVQELAGMLGLGNPAPSPPAAPPQPAALPGLAGVSPDMMNAMLRLAPLMNDLQREDDTTRLLQALRPLLSEARRQRVDRAIQMVRMLRILPQLAGDGNAVDAVIRIIEVDAVCDVFLFKNPHDIGLDVIGHGENLLSACDEIIVS